MDWKELLQKSPIVKKLQVEQERADDATRQLYGEQQLAARTAMEAELPGLDKNVEAARADVLKADAALQKAEAKLRDAISKRRSVGCKLDWQLTTASARLRDLAPSCIDEAIVRVDDLVTKIRDEQFSVTTEPRWKNNGDRVEFVVASNIEPTKRRLEVINAVRAELLALKESYSADYAASVEVILAKIPNGFDVATPEESYAEGVEEGRGGGVLHLTGIQRQEFNRSWSATRDGTVSA